MISRYLFVTVFICIFNGRYVFCARPSLETILTSTTDFFEQLKLNYESQPATPELFEVIDNQLVDYVKKVKNSTHSSRGKRQLDSGKEIGILNGFEKVPSFDVPNVLDVTFFAHPHGADLLWYAAALNSSGISLMQYQGHSFSRVGSHDLCNGTRIISHSCETAVLLVVQTSIGEALVIRLSRENSKHIFHREQTLNVPAASHATLWQGMKQIFFAVATQKNFTVFSWLGENFDRIQSENFGAKRLIPFQTGGSMHLIATNEPRTSILKFLLRSRKFVVVQKLVGAKDATAFHVEKGHMSEHFIALAGQRSTVIYKQSKHRFVPFQEISGADEIRSLTNDAAVLMILINKEEITIYQYDGWKFVKSSARATGIVDVVPLSVRGDELLVLKIKDPCLGDIFRTDRTNPIASTNRTVAPSVQIADDVHEKSNDCRGTFLPMDSFAKNQGSWSFQRIKWRRRKTWASLREETKFWCQSSLEKTTRVAATVPKIKGPVRIQRGYIKNLRAREVNGQSAEKFVKLTDRWNTIVNKTGRQERAVKNYVSRLNPSFESLRAGTVRVNCTTRCRATRTETAVKDQFLKRLRRIDNVEQDLEFRHMRVSVTKNLLCPIPALEFRDATVGGLVNGVRFPAFVEDVLKVTYDQELTGSHTFAELRVADAIIGLDVATNSTRQDIQMETVKIDELNINSGGLLLPLNGNISVMSGSLTVRKAKINGLVDMKRGKMRGKGTDALSPTIYITEPLELSGNFTFRNVKIIESLEVKDLTRPVGKTFKEIASNALPLTTGHVPIHFKFRNDKVSWKNMTLRNFPYKWVTQEHCTGHVIFTGTKQATLPHVTLGKLAYSNLPTPRLSLRLCAGSVVTEGIWQSNLVIERGSAISVKSMNVFDESELSELFLDSATSLNEVPWFLKNLTGLVTVKNANIGKIAGMDYKGLNKSIARWLEPGRLKGPISVKNLKVNNIIAPAGFKMSLPPVVGNAKSMENIFVEKLNGIDFNEFLDNIVKIEDTISLTNVTFAGGLVAEEIFASETSFSLQEKVTLGYMGSKEIVGTLASEAMIVPYVLQFPSSHTPVNIVTNGSVRFISEPSIVNVNDKKLGRLYEEIWMADRATTISAEFIEFKTVSFQNDVTLLKSFDTPSLGPWAGIEDRLLSKTRSQTIHVGASFNSIEAPNVFGAAKSRLRSNMSYLNDLEFNSLKKNDTQVIKNIWNFEELIVTGNANLRGRINKLNLATDVARYDVERNVITGKKIVRGVIARNIDGLKFDELARNALMMNNGNRTIAIKGWKSFKTVQLPYTRVDGTIMGSKIENSLLKSSVQNLKGSKAFQGTLRTPEIVTNGTINNINLKYFIAYQLKKRANSQIIKTPILLSNNLTILGNVTIDGLYQGVELRNLKSSNNSLESVIQRTSELLKFAEGIDVALENRAVYWDKLELLERNSTRLIADPVKNELMQVDGLGHCRIDVSSLHCNNRTVVNFLSTASNGTRLLQARVVTLAGISLVAYITSDPEGGVFILRFDRNANRFRQVTALRVPGIVAGSFTTTTDCLWISLRLRDHIMILRYELWARDFQEWILPGSGAFLMSSTPTEELLILRSDGVWKLGGLAGPRHVFQATLNGQIDTFSFGPDYYLQLTDGNVTTLLKTRYIGN